MASALCAACSSSGPQGDVDAQSDGAIDARADAPVDASLGDALDSSSDARGEASVEADVDATPDPACPTDDPGFGARQRCIADTMVRCTYDDRCPSHPSGQSSNVYGCIDDGGGAYWKLVSPAYTPPCPTLPPNEGDPCPCAIHLAYTSCNYGSCEGMTRAYASCRGVDTFDKEWHVVPLGCNPPEPDAGVDADAAGG